MIPHELVNSTTIENVGLALERLAPPGSSIGEGDEKNPFGRFIREKLAAAHIPVAYEEAFRRWQRRTPPGVPWRRVFQMKAESSILCGMGEATPGENGLTLHPVYGTPYLPGSSLKGIARAWCVQTFPEGPWSKTGESFLALFGGEEPERQSGAVDFLDALITPTNKTPWLAEILTPHNAKYYQGRSVPNGFEGPNPVTFLGAIGTFRVVLEGPPDWLDAAQSILVKALEQQGIGAKTRAGHGRLVPASDDLDDLDQRELGRQQREAERRAFLRASSDEKIRIIIHGSNNPQELEGRLVAWVDEDSKGLRDEQLREVPHDEQAWRAVAVWLGQSGTLKRWEKQQKEDNKDKAARATKRLERLAPYLTPEPEPASVETSAGAKSLFGETDKLPAKLLDIPSNPKRRDEAIKKLTKLLRDNVGRYTQAAVEHGLQVLQENGYPEDALDRLRALYGLK